jgi:DNA-binding transcriptional regulator/RsmH inhibitor MraZ
MRADAAITTFPWRSWTRLVAKDSRIRLPADLRSHVKWLHEEKAEVICVGFAGSAGNIRLEPIEQGLFSSRNEYSNVLKKDPLKFTEDSTALIQLTRFFSNAWFFKVTFETEERRFAINFPEEPRDLNALPQPGTYCVIFGCGEVLEIWPAEAWKKVNEETAANLPEILQRANQELLSTR